MERKLFFSALLEMVESEFEPRESNDTVIFSDGARQE